MTECNTHAIRFSRQGRRRVEADFGGGRTVSDGGLLAVREVDRRTGLPASLAACLSDPRQPATIQHDPSTMLANQFRLLLSSAAYVLMRTLRRTVLVGTGLAKAQVTTIRTKRSARS